MVRLDPDPFLDQLAQMIVRNKEAGSVVVTMKRSASRRKNGVRTRRKGRTRRERADAKERHGGRHRSSRTNHEEDQARRHRGEETRRGIVGGVGRMGVRLTRSSCNTQECKCLIRASDGKKKISAMVTAKEYARFQTFYSNIVKAHMDGLREKSKKKSTRSHVSG